MADQIVLVGCGNMGFAMLKGWLAAGRISRGDALVVEPNETLRDRVGTLGVKAVATADELGDVPPRLVVLAVKPQVILDVAAQYRRFSGTSTFVSIAAGTTMAALEQAIGGGARIIRCMPNTPAAIGKGMMVVIANDRVDGETAAYVNDLLSVSGRVATIADEALMDAVTAVSGSGPAYVFHFIECLSEAARAAGLPDDTARLLAMQTVYGAASLAAESADDPAELRRQVTSPNGTTAAALAVLMGDGRLNALVGEAVEAARLRSIELGK